MNAVSRLTAKELNLAARTVFAEAATEGLNGQMVVAQTMYDQLHHNIIGADGSGFGKTLEEVIKNAYTTPTDQDIGKCLILFCRKFAITYSESSQLMILYHICNMGTIRKAS